MLLIAQRLCCLHFDCRANSLSYYASSDACAPHVHHLRVHSIFLNDESVECVLKKSSTQLLSVGVSSQYGKRSARFASASFSSLIYWFSIILVPSPYCSWSCFPCLDQSNLAWFHSSSPYSHRQEHAVSLFRAVLCTGARRCLWVHCETQRINHVLAITH